MFIVKTEWNVLEENDRVCIFLPDIVKYAGIKNNKVIQQFRQTICEILKNSPKYIVAVVPEHITLDDYYIYEEFYNIELQKIKSMDVFNNDLFNQYLKNDKLYVIESGINEIFKEITKKNTDIVIIDDTSIDINNKIIKEYYNGNVKMGKCYMDDTINISTYLCKSLQRILKPYLGIMHQIAEENDVALVFGSDINYTSDDIRDKITELCKHNLLTAVFCANDDIYDLCKETIIENSSDTPILRLSSELDTEDISILLNEISELSKEYTSIIFIGEFTFLDETSKNMWEKEMEMFGNISIFDPHAYASLVRDDLNEEDSLLYRMTFEPINMISSFIEKDSNQY